MNIFKPELAYQAPCIMVLVINPKNYTCLTASVDSFTEEDYIF